MTDKRKNTVLIYATLAVLSYALHVMIGSLLYEGYNPLAQAVSDLTADDAPGRVVARLFSGVYGFFSVLALVLIVRQYRLIKDKNLALALILLLCMLMISAIGYALFPLSTTGYAGSVQDVMHMVTTGFVVVLTLVSVLLFLRYFYKINETFYVVATVVLLFILMLSPLMMVIIDQAYFGLIERFSVYGVVAYFFMVVWYVCYHRDVVFNRFNNAEGF